MSDPQGVILVLLIGIAGGYAGVRLRLPAGALLGSLGAVLAAHAVMPALPAIDPDVRWWLQVVVGTAIGSLVSADALQRMRQAVSVVVLVIAATILGALIGAFVISGMLDVDYGTALLASTPGGMVEMVLIADALHRDTPTVVMIQLVRIVLTLIVLVPLARLITMRQAEGFS